MDEALAGVKGELAIKLYGPDIFVMDAKAKEVANVLRGIRGVADLDYDHLTGQPQLQILVDRAAASRYGINVQDVQDAIEAATKGRVVSEVFEKERRSNLVVRVGQGHDPVASLRDLMISAPNGERIPLSQLAEFVKAEGLAEILREGNVRRLAIKWSVRERDMGSLVTEVMLKIETAVKLPEGDRLVRSGRFEDQQRALARLSVIVPLVIFIIFVLLFGAFNSVGDSLLIMLNLPFALIGGTLALYLWGTNFNISAAVGYIAVFGVSVLNGVAHLIHSSGPHRGIAPPRGDRAGMRDTLPAHRGVSHRGRDRLPAHGTVAGNRLGDSAAAGPGGHRGPDVLHAADPARPAGRLCALRGPPADISVPAGELRIAVRVPAR